MIHLVLPYPISANRYWATRVVKPKGGQARAMTYVTPEAEEYRQKVRAVALAAGVSRPMLCRVEMWLRLYPARPQDWARRACLDPAGWDDGVLCMDLGNAEKVLADALQGIVYDDDRRIWRQHKERMEPDAKGARVELAIRAIPRRAVPQAELLERAA